MGTEAYNQTLIEAIHEVRSSIEAKETLKEKKISDSTALTDETTLKRSSARLQQGTSQPLPAFPRRVKMAKMKRKEEEVESILRHDGDAGDLDTLEFEVHWAGTTEDDDEWFYYKEVKNMAAFDAYIALHPELASLGKKRQRRSKDTPVEVENKDAMVELREEHVNEIVKASEVRLSCPSCSKVFSSKPGYKYHTRKVCIQDVGFPCVRCKRAFFSEKKLNNHLKVCPEAQQVAGDVNDASVAFAHENTVGKDILSSEPPPPLFSQIQPDNDPRFSVEHARRPPEISHLAPSSSAVSGTAMQQPAAVEVSYASGADQVISTTPAEMLNTIVRDSAALSCEEPSLKSSFLDDKDDVVGGELIGGPDNHQEQGAPSTAEDIVAPSEKISASKARISSHPDDSIMTQFFASVCPVSVPHSNDVRNSGESLGRELENTLALSPRVKKPNTVKTKPIPKSTIKVIFEVPIPARAMDTSAPSASASSTTEVFNPHEESKAVGDHHINLPGDPLSYRNGDEQSDAFGASASLAPYTGRRVKPVKRYDDQDFERAKEELRLARKHAQIESKKTSAAMDGFNKLEDLPGYDGCYSTSMTSSGRNVTKTVKNAAQCTNIEKRNDRKKSKKKSNALKTAGNVNKVNEAFEKKKTPKPIIVYKGEKLTFNFESAFG